MDPPPFRRHPRPLRCFLCRAWKCAFGAQGLHPSRLAVAEVKQAGRKLVRRRRPPSSYVMSKTSKDLAPGCNSICLPSPLLLLSHSAVGGPKAVHPARRRPVEQCRLASSAQPVAALPARRDQDSDVRLGSPCRPTFRIHRPGLQPGRPPPSSLRIWRVSTSSPAWHMLQSRARIRAISSRAHTSESALTHGTPAAARNSRRILAVQIRLIRSDPVTAHGG